MKIKLFREELLRPLQGIIGVVERRQTLPILSNVRIEALEDGAVTFHTSDLEVEMSARLTAGAVEPGATTAPARKLLDICRALPEGAEITLQAEETKLRMSAASGRYSLATLAADEFPQNDSLVGDNRFGVSRDSLVELLRQTSFAMAQQDVRYYLTGLLVEAGKTRLRAVATDGHRLALCDAAGISSIEQEQSVIIPRKAIGELERLLGQADDSVQVVLDSRSASFELGLFTMRTKLIEGQFPDYGRVIPPQSPLRLLADREPLRDALSRVAILANERFRGVRLEAADNELKLIAHNPENEEAEERIPARYTGAPLVIAFNAGYLQDALAVLNVETVELGFSDANSSMLMGAPGHDSCRYVIMPMRL